MKFYNNVFLAAFQLADLGQMVFPLDGYCWGLKTFLFAQLERGMINDIWWGEARDAAKPPMMHGLAPQDKKLSGPKYQ